MARSMERSGTDDNGCATAETPLIASQAEEGGTSGANGDRGVGLSRSARKLELAVFAGYTAAGANVTLPYTIAVYLVMGYGFRGPRVGQMTGLLACMAHLGMFCSSFAWGVISNRIGRKRSVLIGCFSSCVCLVAFGMAESYSLAAVVRFVDGAMNGNLPVLRTAIGEVGTSADQTHLMLVLSMAVACGFTLGPIIGGLMSDPCSGHWAFVPLCHGEELFARRPYLLPCLFTSLLNFLAFVACLFMPETAPGLKKAGGGGPGTPSEAENSGQGSQSPAPSNSPGTLRSRSNSLDGSAYVAAATALDISQRLRDPPSSVECGVANEPQLVVESSAPWWQLRPVQMTVAGYACMQLVFTLYDELMPVYAASPKEYGGLGLLISQLGLPLAVGGVGLFIFSALAYKRLQARLGVRVLTQRALFVAAPIVMLPPFVSMLDNMPAVMVCLAVITALRSAILCSVFTSSGIMVNLASPPENLGEVNGAAQAFGSLLRAFGPAIGGSLWTLTIQLQLPLNQYIVFAVVAVGAVAVGCSVYNSKLGVANLME